MKATCPNCQAAYRIADEKVPDTGAKILCPRCKTTFVVHRRPSDVPAASGRPPASTPRAPLRPQGQGAPPRAADSSKAALLSEGDLFSALPPVPPSPPPAAPQAGSAPPAHRQATPARDLPWPGGTGTAPGAGIGTSAPPSAEPPSAATRPPPPPPSAKQPPSQPAPPEAAVSESKTPHLDALNGEATVSAEIGSTARTGSESAPPARGVSAIRAQSRSRRSSASGYEALEGHRVRTPRGLTYDFPTRAAMDQWLAEQGDLSGFEYAAPGQDWRPVADGIDSFESAYDPSKPVEVRGARPVVAVSPDAAQLEDAKRRRKGSAHGLPRYAGPRTGPLLWSFVLLSLLLSIAGTAVSLTRYGVVDLTAYPPADWIGVRFPETDVQQAEGRAYTEQPPAVPADRDPEDCYRRALSAGRRALRSKRFSRAALELNRALSVHPGSVEALEGLARAFNGLGDRDRALATLKKARAIDRR